MPTASSWTLASAVEIAVLTWAISAFVGAAPAYEEEARLTHLPQKWLGCFDACPYRCRGNVATYWP
jgi:hypothetical protein